MSSTLRVLTSALALALVGGSLAACGTDEPSTPSAGTSSSAAAAYPVTVTHKLGTTKLDKAPQRIVALSDADLDALLLLGIQPVGIGASVHDGGITPWAKPKLTGQPALLEPGENGVDAEQVAKLNPDLVLAGGDYYVDSEYKALSPLVPTTAYETGPFEDPWQITLRQVAKLVGKVEQGEQIIRDVEAKVAGVRTQYPALAGKTFSLSQAFEAGTIGVLRSPEDTGVKSFNSFGMELTPAVKALKSEDFAVTLSLEKIATIDADVVLVYPTEPQFKTALEANTLFKNLKAVRGGHYVPLDLVEFLSLRNPSPLSTPYFIDNVLPKVAAAAAAS
ncbi:ABC transporter substrate-binding protein [Micromonospora parathelypteridis]|uniref:Iron complex transport system substrate-binding protein n=1 Tax=Micromonospora parathelypteridis TaxID=1839617 RepID=A0A840VUE7_9ACTN|nr:ABC transporter substrate-binding protein [Micromonospora parathelypteridis]MBB5476190.1 iron complex transport system substrate-binding protein [Micromonospora parathelypteridis]GGO13885.1 iron siderophore-binding protein [Micromonospora parathelypteridis]